MRRTNLVLDERLLEATKHALGTKSYSATVNLALAEALWVKKILDFPAYFGSGIWQGDLPAMREDQRPSKRSSAKSKRTKK